MWNHAESRKGFKKHLQFCGPFLAVIKTSVKNRNKERLIDSLVLNCFCSFSSLPMRKNTGGLWQIRSWINSYSNWRIGSSEACKMLQSLCSNKKDQLCLALIFSKTCSPRKTHGLTKACYRLCFKHVCFWLHASGFLIRSPPFGIDQRHSDYTCICSELGILTAVSDFPN